MFIFWLLCSILSYGIAFGYLQNKDKELSYLTYWHDVEGAFYISLLGPIGLIISIYKSEFCKYGIKFF